MRLYGPQIVADSVIPHEINMGMINSMKFAPQAFGVETRHDGDSLGVTWKDSKYTIFMDCPHIPVEVTP